MGSGYPEISWHGTKAWEPDWSESSRTLAFMLCGRHAKGGTVEDDDVYVAMSSHHEPLLFEPPQLPAGRRWHVAVNTSMPSPEDIHAVGQEPVLNETSGITVAAYSVVVLVGRAMGVQRL